MSKITGLGMALTVDNAAGAPIDISNDVNGVALKTSQGEVDVTGLDKLALERLPLLGDAEVSITGAFNPELSHGVFKNIETILAGESGRIVLISYDSGAVTLSMRMLFTDYSVDRGGDGAMTFTATARLADGTAISFGP